MESLQDESPDRTLESLAAPGDFVPTGWSSRTSEAEPTVDWQTAMKRAIRSVTELRRQLSLPPLPTAAPEPPFSTFVPLEFLRNMRPGDERDPLLLQVLPSAQEHIPHQGFVSDPVGDLPALAAPGLLHKYAGRALIMATGACGVHCRYCFRREFPYAASGARPRDWDEPLQYLAANESVEEVLLSGGDPLTIVDATLFRLLDQLESISHLRRLRIHTRMPIVIPQRLTEALIERLRASRLACWVVVHANHPRELSEAVLERLGRLIDHGIPVLNQAVLLRGVNDDAETLVELSRVLVNHRVQPYYLHQLDRVRGATHFEVAPETGRELMAVIRSRLPGYAVPTYVAERPGHTSKTPLEFATGDRDLAVSEPRHGAGD